MSSDKSNAGKGGGVGNDLPRVVIDGSASSVINGGGGGDLLFGGAGNDTIAPGAGNDWVDAGAGNDTAIHDLRTDGKGWDFLFGGQGNDTLEIRLSAAQLADPKVRADLVALNSFIATGKGEAKGNDYDHIGTFSALGLKVAGWENLHVTVDDKDYDLSALTGGGSSGNSGGESGGDSGGGTGGGETGGGDDTPAAPTVVTVTTPDTNLNTATVVSQWADQGVHVRALVGDAADPESWHDTSFGTKTVSFSITGSNTTDKSIQGNYHYSGLGVNASGGIDGGELDSMTGNGASTTELIAVSFDKPMESVTLELSALFDGKDDPNVAGADRGPYDAGYVEKAEVIVYGTDGKVMGTVEVTGTVNGLAKVTLDAADFGGAIGSVALAPVDDGAGRSGNNSDFLLRSVTATEMPADTTASAPTLTAEAATGTEDHAIALDLSAALTDTDGSESLSVTIGNLPDGATLSAGTHNDDGTWTLSAADLHGLTLTPPKDFSGSIALDVTAVSTESNGGASAATSVSTTVMVEAVADAPTLAVSAATGSEDHSVALDIAAALTDIDGSETLSVTIGNLPDGATLSAGTHNADGTWTLAAADLDGLTLTPPKDFSGDAALSVTATSAEANGSTATTSATLTVSVAAVADAPTLAVEPATGAEDHAVALDIAAALTDTDGSETLSVTIGNLPDGAVLSAGTHNADGTWTLAAADLHGLTLTPPKDFSGAFDLSVTATSAEATGGTATTATTLSVTVTPVADAPELSATNATGAEDSAIALDISAALTDVDGSETLTVTLANLPDGAALSAGTKNDDGTWTLHAADLHGLTLTPPKDFNGDLALTVTATSTESDGSSVTTAGTPLTVTVTPVADAPDLSVRDAQGLEDHAVALNVAAALSDAGGGEALSVTIGNMPADATLSAGTKNDDGTWTLTPADLHGLTLSAPKDFSGDIALSVTATATEANGDHASTNATLTVSLAGIADAPSLEFSDADAGEDDSIPLDIHAALTDTDGSESLSVTIGNLPDGSVLSAGTHNADGTWTLSAADLDGLTLTPPTNYAGNVTLAITATSTEADGDSATTTGELSLSIAPVADAPTVSVADATGTEDHAVPLSIAAALTDTDGSETLSVTISDLPDGVSFSAGTQNDDGSWTMVPADLAGLTFTPPKDFSGQITMTVTGVSTESNGSQAVAAQTLTVVVTPITDAPTLTVAAASGAEDQPVALHIDAGLTDTDGSETLSLVIGNLPPGTTLSAGTPNVDGTWTLSQSDLDGLTLTPPKDFSGDLQLHVTAVSTEWRGDTATTESDLAVHVTPVADAPLLTVADVTGSEDTAIPLDLSAALTDTDGSETLSVTIGDLPPGATLSAGTQNADGSWTLSAADLKDLTLTPPANLSGDLALTVTATSTESDGSTASTSSGVTVHVTPVADAPLLTVADVTGSEDTAIPLDLSAALTDTDGSETLSVTIGDLPPGATLSAGTHNADGSWTLSAADLKDLTLTPPANLSGDLALTVTATSTESDGSTASTSSGVTVHVTPVADAPLLTVADVTGSEDTAIPLDLSAALTDTDGSETLSVTIGDLPPGATLSAGTHNADGSWTLSAADLKDLTLTPPANLSGDLALTVTATSTESDGSTASTSSGVTVHVTPVADAPLLTVADVTGSEDTAIPLDLSAALTDTDGSETLSVTIGDLPPGATLSAGTHNADGSWTLSAADLKDLTLTPPANLSGDLALTVTATSTESDGSTASTSSGVTVHVTPVADAPLLTVADVTGSEDTAIPLDLSAALTDTDGSETLSVTISDLPPGATLSAGTHNADGSWTLSAADLKDLTLTPPANLSGDLALTVTATSTESDGSTASTSSGVTVHVTPVADAPLLTVADVTGSEDTAIPLDLSAALTDTDGSETLSVTIGDLPPGATLSAGTQNADGSWTLSAADLKDLTLTPPANLSGDLALTVTATSTESDGSTASTSSGVTVHVTPVADAPLLTVADVTGSEDTAIPLDLSAALTDTDGSETLSVTIGDLPPGATLSAGTQNADGSWTLSAADLKDLTLTPPANLSGDLALTVTATSTESDGSTASTSSGVTVHVTPVADAPLLTVADVTGSEDTAIPLDLSAALTDTDGSETLSVTIGDLPPGATLSAGTHNADGSWTLSAADLKDLTLTPPANLSGDLALTVTATSTESDGSTASTSSGVTVHVTPVADAPLLTVADVTGSEDTAIPLDLSAALTDTDGSETLSVTISDLPPGATLSAGTHNADGSWTLSAADLKDLTLTPPANLSGDLALTVTATSTESDGSTASTSSGVTVHVTPVADAPLLTVADVTGSEDTAIPLDLSAALTDTDGSETLSVTISDLPPGATLSAGTHNADGSWTLSAADLKDLTLTPPANLSGDLALTVTATSTESDGSTASTSSGVTVHVTPVADAPLLTVADVTGSEDTAIPLDLSAALTDTDGSETLSVTIGDLPPGATLSAGTHNADGSWTLSAADLKDLTLTPPANLSGDLALTVTATSTESDGSTASTSSGVTVHVTPVADAPLLTVADVTGSEDTAIPLDLSAALTDTDGSETLSVTIGDLPPGATLSAGTHNADGSWTLSAADLKDLTLTPPANLSGDLALTVTATSTESDGSTASTSSGVTVHVTPVADAPLLTVADVTGSEDTAIPLDLSAALTDTDGSETLSVTIGDLPPGATLSAGTHNADGSWTLSAADLKDLTLTPPANLSGDLALTVTATSTESDGSTASTSSGVTVHVTPVADAPLLTVADVTGSEDTAIPLDLSAALTDTDGSETLSVTISDLPPGATLSAGTHNADGSWTLSAADLKDLTLTPPANLSGDLALTVTATSTESDGSTASTSSGVTVHVTPVADLPDLVVSDTTGAEDTAIPLTFSATLVDTDGSESLSVTLIGLPGDATLSAGTHNADGSWTLTGAEVAGVTLTPPKDFSGELSFAIVATSTESDGSTAVTGDTMTVTVTPVADTPDLTVAVATGAEDNGIPLDIQAALTDTSGNETLSVTISNLPDGASLSAGTQNADGSWSVDPADLGGLSLTPPANYSGTISLTVAATSQDGDSTATQSATLVVTVTPVADAPVLDVAAAAGAEDSAIALPIDAALFDTDGSETLSVTVTGLPGDALLSAGTHNADGSWTLTAADLKDLTVTPPANMSGPLTLSVTATSTESDGSTATVSKDLTVTVTPVADLPTLTVADATGDEDTAIALNIGAALTDTDGSETLSVTIANVPDGAILSAGTHNADGTWTVAGGDLAGLTLTPPKDFNGDIALSVSATSTESDGTTATTDPVSLTVSVAPVADDPTLTVAPASGAEDTPIALSIAAAPPDGTSAALTVTLDGLPAGATLSDGTHNVVADGSHAVDLSGWDLTALALVPPQNYSGTLNLTATVTALMADGSTPSTSAPLDVTVAPVADAPTLTVAAASTGVNAAVALDLSAALVDTDGSETLSVTIAGLPDGAMLSAGTHNADGSWTLTAAEIAGLTLTPAVNEAGAYDLTVTATATESDGGTASTAATLHLDVVDGPNRITVSNAVTADGAQDLTDSYVLSYLGADSQRTIDGATLDIAGVAAATTVTVTRDDSDNPTVTADQGFGSVRNVLAAGDGGHSVTTKDFVSSDVTMTDGGDSAVVIHGGLEGVVNTGAGNDTIAFDSVTATAATAAGTGTAGTLTVNSGAGDDVIQLSALSGVSVAGVIDAGDGNDTVTIVNSSADTVIGGLGDDSIAAGGGNDWIDGGDGNDSLSGGAGSADSLYGGAGNDVLRDSDGLAVADGGSGDDTMTVGYTVDIGDPAVQHLLMGGAGADTMTLTANLANLHLTIYGDGATEVADDGADTITLMGTYAVADVMLGGGADNYQGDNSGGSANTTLLVDHVHGGSGDDRISTGGGDDLLYGDDGNDSLYGGFGNDTLYGGTGADDLYGNGGDDVLYGDDGNDSLRGYDGNDTLVGGAGDDWLSGDNNNDSLMGGDGNDSLDGGAGADTLDGGVGLFDSMTGGTANDVITDEDGAIYVDGGTGSDTLTLTYTSAGGHPELTRYVSGGDGIDTITMVSQDATLHFTIDGDDWADATGDNNDTVTLTGVYADATVHLGGGDDKFVSEATDSNTMLMDTVYGGDGNDTINTGGGNDWVDGGTGDDLIHGGGGKDLIYGGDGNDIIYGDAGNDTIDGGLGLFDQINAGTGVDVITDSDGAMLITADTGNDTISVTYTDDGGVLDARQVYGGDGLDNITLTSNDQNLSFVIYGDGTSETTGDKSDTVRMYGTYLHADVYLGGGNDDYQGDNGGSAGDRVDYVWGGSGNDRIALGGGNDIGYGETGDDALYGGDGDDTLYGGDGNDVVNGNVGNDQVHGDAGNDTLWGQDGNDTLDGGAGNDVFYGGDGDDVMIGGTGDDTFTGGTGADVYIVHKGDGNDRIQDMAIQQDKIDLTDFHFNTVAEVEALAHDSTDGVVITLQTDQQILLSGLTVKQLADAMFII